MALGTTHESATTLANVIPEVWSDKVNEFYRANLVAANFFTDLSAELESGGDILNIPTMSTLTANVKGNGSQVTLNAQTGGTVQLTVTTWYETSFLIEDREAQTVLNSYMWQERRMKDAAYTTASVYEQAILDLFAGFSQTTGTSAAAVADSNIRVAIQYLDAADAPQDDRAFFFTPKAIWSDLMAIDKFTLVQNTGGADPILKGAVGMLYGIPVISSTKIGGENEKGYFALAHSDAIVHASTIMRTQANYIPEYLGVLVTSDVLYGVIENRDTSGVWISCAS